MNVDNYIVRGKTTKKKNPRHSFNGVWVKGDLIVSDGKYYIHPRANLVRTQGELGKLIAMHEIVPETATRCTGLFDHSENPVEIFEGDILCFVDTDGTKSYGAVKHGMHLSLTDDRKELGFYIEFSFLAPIKRLTCNWRSDIGYWMIEQEKFNVTVVGNLFDNPEIFYCGVDGTKPEQGKG